jgi:hypothetical protein
MWDQRGGYVLPYSDWEGNRTGYYRVRFKTVTPGAGKYKGPSDTPVQIYFPTTFVHTWRDYLESPKHSAVVITEGEKKAACASKKGLATIAIGGVDCWRDGETGALHPDIAKIEWKDRPVVLAFDADFATNDHVRNALIGLGRELLERGADVKRVSIPSPDPTVKVGLDDFLKEHGIEGWGELDLEHVDELLLRLEEYSRRYVFVPEREVSIYDLTKPHAKPMSLTAWKTMRAVDNIKPAKAKQKKVVLANEYVESKLRLEAEGVRLVPGEGAMVDGYVNRWAPRGCEPWPEKVEDSEVAQFLELMDFLFGEHHDRREWFLDWLAYPLQNPGTKLYSATFLHSNVHRLGKSLTTDTIAAIYGMQNVSHIKAESFDEKFNGWVESEFVVVDELGTGSTARALGREVRKVITSETLPVEYKYKDPYEAKLYCNVMLCSNYPDSIDINFGEGRMFVHRIVATEPKPKPWYRAYRLYFLGDKMQSPYTDGLRKLYRWLLQRDLSNFYPQDDALETSDLREAIVLTKKDFEHWLAEEVVCEPDAFSERVHEHTNTYHEGCDLFDKDQIILQYLHDRKQSISVKQATIALQKHPGIAAACSNGGEPKRLTVRPNGKGITGRASVCATRSSIRWSWSARQSSGRRPGSSVSSMF